MLNSGIRFRAALFTTLMLMPVILSGCKSKMDKALEQAQKQAAATGQAQQVVSVDSKGITTMTTVQPPMQGQASGAISTTTTPPPVGAPLPPPSAPAVSAVQQASAPEPIPEPIPPPEPVTSSGQVPSTGQEMPSGMSIPAGTTLTILIDQSISVKNSRVGDRFSGEVADNVQASDNSVLVPRGASVSGVVEVSHRRGIFKGESLLGLRLTRITLNGKRYSLSTHEMHRGGDGAGGDDRDLSIPAESVLRFRLSSRLVLQ